MSVETIMADASAAAEEQKAASPTAGQSTEEVQKPAEEQPVQDKPASEEIIAEPEVEQEPDLEVAPETSGDYAKYKKMEVVVDGKSVPLFQALPDLRNILGREHAFSELGQFSEVREIVQRIPTIADAETLVSDAENKRILGQTFREDLPAFVESLKESDPLAFQNFAKQLPDVLAATDETLWVEQARTYTGRVLNNAFSIAQRSGDKDLQAAVDVVARSLGISLGVAAAQPAQVNTEVQKLRQQIAERNQQDEQSAFNSFWNETDGVVIDNAVSEIESAIKKALPAVEAAQLGRMTKETYGQVLNLLNAQPQTVSQVNSYREAARKGKRGIAEHKTIVNFMTQRAKQVIPKAVKSVVDEWSGSVLKLNTDKLEKKKAVAAGTRDVGTGPQGTTSAAAKLPSSNGKPRSAADIFKELAAGTYTPPNAR